MTRIGGHWIVLLSLLYWWAGAGCGWQQKCCVWVGQRYCKGNSWWGKLTTEPFLHTPFFLFLTLLANEVFLKLRLGWRCDL